jgi:hypothetical protein
MSSIIQGLPISITEIRARRREYQVLSLNNDPILGAYNALDNSSFTFIFASYYNHLRSSKLRKLRSNWDPTFVGIRIIRRKIKKKYVVTTEDFPVPDYLLRCFPSHLSSSSSSSFPNPALSNSVSQSFENRNGFRVCLGQNCSKIQPEYDPSPKMLSPDVWWNYPFRIYAQDLLVLQNKALN